MEKFFDKLYKDTKENFFNIVWDKLLNHQKMFIVTANPEAFIYGKQDKELESLLLDEATTVVADGIGIVKGAKKIGVEVKERIPGIDIAENLLKFGNELSKSVFFLGAKQEVIDALCSVVTEKYPNLKIAGAVNGYVPDKDAVFEEIKKAKPDIIMVALGIPAQEKLIYKHFKDFEKGIFIGVGGSFDVLSGTKQRAPKFFIDNNLEWLYRIIKEPSRIKRFYNNNIKFILRLKRK
jgi:N-acetylglucosaminyldiphosphoundecaprenol N-acetyl-beta-D-mannosaminyltransferase